MIEHVQMPWGNPGSYSQGAVYDRIDKEIIGVDPCLRGRRFQIAVFAPRSLSRLTRSLSALRPWHGREGRRERCGSNMPS
jgi:hypothetical protein